MTNIKTKFILRINSMLASVIAALGVVSCAGQKTTAKQQIADNSGSNTEPQIEEVQVSREEMVVCMYGVPRAQYIIKGVVTNGVNTPLANKDIDISAGYDKIHITTDTIGEFSVTFDGFPTEEISFEIDGEQYTEKVVYDSDPIDSWNRGTATIQVQIVVSKEPAHEQQVPRIMVKYGVPPVRHLQ